MQLKLALPKGRLMAATAALLDKAGLCLDEYGSGSRSYRPACRSLPGLQMKVFQEKDIPIQVAVGNYDLGICGLDWIDELLAKFPASSVVKVRDLGYGYSQLHLVSSSQSLVFGIDDVGNLARVVRVASEYPNLAEAFALRLRLKRFQIFPLWGAAESYPPDSAELALVAGNGGLAPGLRSVVSVLSSSAYLIANRRSWESKDMAELLAMLERVGDIARALGQSPRALGAGVREWLGREGSRGVTPDVAEAKSSGSEAPVTRAAQEGCLHLALPDGHQQPPTLEFLQKAGIRLDGYGKGVSRPATDLPGVYVKVIRPQDMPLQVACGNFDLAVSGRDWLLDHLSRFPGSPVKELLGLGFGKVRVVAVVSESVRVETAHQLRAMVHNGRFPRLRVASEYVNLADKYARDNHLGHYQIIPTWGASEAFLPEDADLLIENTQTGRTLAENKLKIIDTLLESQACLIGRVNGPREPAVRSAIESLVERFRRALKAGG